MGLLPQTLLLAGLLPVRLLLRLYSKPDASRAQLQPKQPGPFHGPEGKGVPQQ